MVEVAVKLLYFCSVCPTQLVTAHDAATQSYKAVKISKEKLETLRWQALMHYRVYGHPVSLWFGNKLIERIPSVDLRKEE